jgi:hypothetical protein
MTLQPLPSEFIYEENLFSFLSVYRSQFGHGRDKHQKRRPTLFAAVGIACTSISNAHRIELKERGRGAAFLAVLAEGEGDGKRFPKSKQNQQTTVVFFKFLFNFEGF